MKNSYDVGDKFAIGTVIVFGAFIISTLIVWVVNAFKLAGVVMSVNWQNMGQNDWSSVIVHAIGLIGPAAWITVWF